MTVIFVVSLYNYHFDATLHTLVKLTVVGSIYWKSIPLLELSTQADFVSNR